MAKPLEIEKIIEKTKLPPATVYRLLRKGEMPGRKIRGRWYSTDVLIDKFISEYYDENNIKEKEEFSEDDN